MVFSYDQFHEKTKNALSNFGRSKELRAYAHSRSDIARFRVAEKFLKENGWDGVGKFEGSLRGKDAEAAEKARQRGNKAFLEKRMKDALMEYNVSVRLAPWPSSDAVGGEDKAGGPLSLAFGNRSAVMFHLKRYAECVVDVDRAVAFGYASDKLRTILVRKVKALLAENRFADALDCLRQDFADRLGFGFEDETNKIAVIDEEVGQLYKLASSSTLPELLSKPEPYYPTGVEMRAYADGLTLANGPHTVFRSASSLVQFKYDPGFGRHFVAARDIDVGAVLLKEPCFVSSHFRDSMTENCVACLVYTQTPYPCRTCQSVVFCSETCAEGSKALLHSKECHFLWLLQESELAEVTVLVMRTLLMKTPEEWREFSRRPPGNQLGFSDPEVYKSIPNPKEYRWDDYDNVFALVRRPEEYVLAIDVGLTLAAVYIIQLLEQVHFKKKDLDKKLRCFLGGLALRHMGNLTLNRTTSVDYSYLRRNTDVLCTILIRDKSVAEQMDLTSLDPGKRKDLERALSALEKIDAGSRSTITACAIHPTLALFNNACNPNLLQVHFGDVAVAFAIRPIKRGEVLNLGGIANYLTSSRDDRREKTNETFGFLCRCRACEEDWPTGIDLKSFLASGQFPVKCPACGHRFADYLTVKRILESREGKCPSCQEDILERVKTVLLGWQTTSMDEDLLPFVREAFKVFEEPNYALSMLQMVMVPIVFSAKANRRYCDDYDQ